MVSYKALNTRPELDSEVVISILETTTQHGAIEGKTQTSTTKFYNLDAIIAVGYRVSSLRATRFRQGAYLRRAGQGKGGKGT